jgi:MFS family permease
VSALHAFGGVVRDATLVRIQVAYLGFNMAENGTWVAIIVYAYARGGAAAAGLVAVIQLVPSAIAAPLAAYAGDRFRRDRVLATGYMLQGLTMAFTAAALFASAPVAIVYPLAASAAVSVTLSRPAQSALLPSVTATPEELTAANGVSGVVEGVGLFLGPLVAGIALAVGNPGTVFAIFAVTSFISAALVARLRVDAAAVTPTERIRADEVWRETFGGFSVLRRAREPRLLVLLLAMVLAVEGALDVLYVAASVDLLGFGPGGAGFLTAAFGVGGIIGAAATVVLVGRRRLTPPMAVGGLVLGAPIATIGAVPSAGAAPALFVIAGAGASVADVSGRTLLQRVTSDSVLARVFGVLEGLSMVALAIGSAVASVLVETIGIRGALAVTGALLPVAIAIAWRPLLSIDRHAPAPDERVVELLRSLPLFAPLPPPAMERLVANLVPLEVPAGTKFIREGERGDRFYVIVEGEADVTIGGEHVSTKGPGAYVGEIALLRDTPRTATVAARTPLRLLALERKPFLQAVTGHPQSLEAADRSVSAYVEPAP